MKMSEESFRKKFLWNLGLLCAAQVRTSTRKGRVRCDLVTTFLSGPLSSSSHFLCHLKCVSDSSVTQNALNG